VRYELSSSHRGSEAVRSAAPKTCERFGVTRVRLPEFVELQDSGLGAHGDRRTDDAASHDVLWLLRGTCAIRDRNRAARSMPVADRHSVITVLPLACRARAELSAAGTSSMDIRVIGGATMRP
jgi:hypothetical protein